MRSFIALELPENIISYLQEVASSFSMSILGRFVKKKDYHSTLFFFENFTGNVDAICRYIDSLGLKTVSAELTGTRFFKRGEEPSVLYVSYRSDEVVSLFENLRDFIKKEKISFDEKPFKGHITICRIKKLLDPGDFYDRIKIFSNINIDFRFRSISFFESKLTPDGPIYKNIFRKEFE
ncbi:MAG: RNA 2',3'-cyclic phosphodiesterase [Calditerrivibrio sp.]|nr:RNA 2',3'-cyclic phosphodiesterase [Calditerrivibrio sp.]